MGVDNGTAVTEFVLLGFSEFGSLRRPLFWGVLCMYVVTLLGNSLIIFLTLADSALHSPMYFFLCHFSLAEILYTTTIVPRMLRDLLSSCPTIPLGSCFTQLYFFALFGIAECCLLAAMAYDRYAAICRPLHYATLMNWGACVGMVGASYLMGVITGTSHSLLIFTLPFHGDNVIHHFLCDILPVLKLASASIFWGEVGILGNTITFILIPFLLIMASYVCILATILGVSTAQGRRKIFSTCSSHLFVVILFYGTATVAYIKPQASASQDTDQVLALFYTVVTPMCNPFVYSLRNKEVTGAMKRVIKKHFWSS
ncbi:olfactory receptor 9-like [Perognathus longimembris pacificus]|uniref:olfactory receptor 9-like n=1 Tax=Perognathus longimembris pacificus TaxID=214514 RepID=UPI0020184917|nr:olfactory receptor 9-like [Perognathus longimembris pacificus]